LVDAGDLQTESKKKISCKVRLGTGVTCVQDRKGGNLKLRPKQNKEVAKKGVRNPTEQRERNF